MAGEIADLPQVSSGDLKNCLPDITEPTVVVTWRNPRFVIMPVGDYEQMIKRTNEQMYKGGADGYEDIR
ncbi:type II toxin-antitoxin system Phd/YefM family antitoxin [Marinobacterium jannaschii]|uniref:type II toxin-antitoxin system Phd/YefM family antitoxin n=1 Tax=Marinobacterium jannaschii TaxID=64970 RepID=UPI0004814155|nr:type II toxin-antitoxin system Phd/YefM family antitoxin [Marinobacterium jannaschii]